jgi:hypothetical protein
MKTVYINLLLKQFCISCFTNFSLQEIPTRIKFSIIFISIKLCNLNYVFDSTYTNMDFQVVVLQILIFVFIISKIAGISFERKQPIPRFCCFWVLYFRNLIVNGCCFLASNENILTTFRNFLQLQGYVCSLYSFSLESCKSSNFLRKDEKKTTSDKMRYIWEKSGLTILHKKNWNSIAHTVCSVVGLCCSVTIILNNLKVYMYTNIYRSFLLRFLSFSHEGEQNCCAIECKKHQSRTVNHISSFHILWNGL